MTSQANGIGIYKRTRTGKAYNPNGNGPSAEQMARVAAAGAQIAQRRADEAEARQQMIDEDERASAHLMAGYTSTTCGEY